MTGGAFERLLDALHRHGSKVVRREHGRQAMAQCPAPDHDDRNPSLSVTSTSTRVLVYCHAGCDDVAVLDALGLAVRDLYDEPRGRDLAQYRYTDLDGLVLRTVHRQAGTKPGTKTFRQYPAPGTPDIGEVPAPLYRLPQVAKAVAAGTPVYLVEGEEDVHALEALGAVATTAPAGGSNFHLADVSVLTGASVVAVPDQDATGRKWLSLVRDALDGVVASMEVRLAAQGKDACDHLAAGYGLDDLQPLADDPAADDADVEALAQHRATTEELRRQRARKAAAEIILTEELEAQRAAQHGRSVDGATFILDAPSEVPAIWGDGANVGWAEGESCLLVGPPGVGKTTLCVQLVRGRLGLDRNLLGMPVSAGTGRVLYLAMDRPEQIRRAMARVFTEADRQVLDERLTVWRGPPPADLAQRPETLLDLARVHEADTVVIDSLKDAAIGIATDEVGAGYNRARQLALASGIQLLELHHNTKRGPNGAPAKTLEDVYGSIWITAGAGSVVALLGAPGDPVVELRHLKQVRGELGPWQVLHDHDTGRTRIYQQADLLMLASAWSSRGGLTVAASAEALFSTEKPTRSEVEKARRKLTGLVRDGHLVEHAGSGGGASGNTGARYFRASAQSLVTTHEPTHAAPAAGSGHEPLTPLTAAQVNGTHGTTHATHAPEHSRSHPPLRGGGGVPGARDRQREAQEALGAELFAKYGRSAS